MLVSDALSGAYIKNLKPGLDENSLIHHLHFVILDLPISNKLWEQFKETQFYKPRDPKKFTNPYTVHYWRFPHKLRPYFTHRGDISYHEGLLLKDQQIILPNALRSEMKSKEIYAKEI